jgi:hypothetical protein
MPEQPSYDELVKQVARLNAAVLSLARAVDRLYDHQKGRRGLGNALPKLRYFLDTGTTKGWKEAEEARRKAAEEAWESIRSA